ncbi:MAG: hypothetical protein AAFY26_21705 [Cyanobacteria bacterium J06638_22]
MNGNGGDAQTESLRDRPTIKPHPTTGFTVMTPLTQKLSFTDYLAYDDGMGTRYGA